MLKKVFNIIREGAYLIFTKTNKQYASLAHTHPELFNERLYLWFFFYHFTVIFIIVDIFKYFFNITVTKNIFVIIFLLACIFVSNHQFFFRVVYPHLSVEPFGEDHKISNKFFKAAFAMFAILFGLISIFLFVPLVKKLYLAIYF